MPAAKGDTTYRKAFRGLPTNGVDLDSLLCDAELASIADAKEGRVVLDSADRVSCRCPETRIKGKYVALHRAQDCTYRQARAALVLEAERRTFEIIGEFPVEANRKDRDSYGYRFTTAFADEMDRLAAPLLKQSSNGNGSAPPAVEAQSIVPPGLQNDETQAAIICWKP